MKAYRKGSVWLIAASAGLLFSSPNFAAVFGPETYEECITDSMKGVTSDLAASAVIAACSKQFPRTAASEPASRALTKVELAKLSGEARGARNAFGLNIYNGNEDLKIQSVTIEIKTLESGKEVRRSYTEMVSISPKKVGLATFSIIGGDSVNGWGILSAEGF